METKVTPVYFNVEDVGKNIKQTKKRFTWVLEMNQKMFTFVLDASMISGKVKLTCNNQIVAMSEDQSVGTFQHTMLLDTFQITVMAIGDSYEMRINNQVFSHLLNQEKTKKEFVKNDQACQDFVLDQKITGSSTGTNGLKKTIKLKIGSMKNSTTKPNSKSLESDDWNKMLGDEANTFPNYFDLEKGSSGPIQIDYSKVSMKKKPVQPLSNSQEGAQNLLDCQTQVIEITPEQFCTMQQLFRTQVPMQMNKSQINGSTPLTTASQTGSINPNDFGTMQMLFQTQYGVNPLQSQTKQESEPVEISINVQDFSTMQWMFNTMNFGVQNVSSVQTKVQPPKASSLLDELCANTSETVTATQSDTPTFNMADFSTMQMMFATNNIQLNSQVQSNNSEPKSVTKSNASQPNPMDFTTMANLFRTMNLSQSLPSATSTQQPSQQVDVLNSVMGLSNSSNNANTQPINMNDFGTMQMLFKTNGTGLPSTLQKPPTTISSELKQNSVPFQF